MEQYPSPDMADVQLVSVLSALADPIRLDIVRALADGQPHPKTAEVWHFDVQKSTLSHHFRVLRESGVTRTHLVGNQRVISLRTEDLEARFPGVLGPILTAGSREEAGRDGRARSRRPAARSDAA